jgi:hypothetical protein
MLGNYRLPVDSLVVQLVEVGKNLELLKIMMWVGCLGMLHHSTHLIVILRLRLWLLGLARRALVIFLGMALPARRAPIVEIHSLLALAVIKFLRLGTINVIRLQILKLILLWLRLLLDVVVIPLCPVIDPE